MLKTIKILICFLCFHICGNAQISSKDSIKIDSLKSIIDATQSDLIRIRSLVEWDKIIYKFDTKLDSILLNKIMSNCSTALEKNINDSIANLIKKNLYYFVVVQQYF